MSAEVWSREPSSKIEPPCVMLSPQLIEKYERTFENGYNIYTDKGYVQWLREFHPDSLPSAVAYLELYVY